MLGLSLPLMGVALLMNPAAKGTCVMNSGLTVSAIPDELAVTTAAGSTVTLNKQQLTHTATIITVGSHVQDTDRSAIVLPRPEPSTPPATTNPPNRPLAYTGANTARWGLIGGGIALLGAALLSVARWRKRRTKTA